jgi:hypothetical protein
LWCWVIFWSIAFIGQPYFFPFCALMIGLGFVRLKRTRPKGVGHVTPSPSDDLASNEPGMLLGAQASRSELAGRSTKSWLLGQEGERRVAAVLAALPTGWHVLHSIPLGTRGRDIDHLLMGPGGVFSINTKNVSGTITISGIAAQVDDADSDFAVTSIDEARRASECLSRALRWRVVVAPLVVSVRAPVVWLPPVRVNLLTLDQLLPWLTQLPPALPSAAADQIYAVARQRHTWLAGR